MRIEVSEDYQIVLKEVYSPITLVTQGGEKLSICMRDNGFEIALKDTSVKTSDKEEYFTKYVAEGCHIRRMDKEAEYVGG